MRIGILQCDDVRSSLSTEFGEYPAMIKNQLAVIDETFMFHTYKAHHGQLPDDVSECDAYILTGSRCTVFDTDALWANSLLDFIVRLNKANIKTIGICFGYHLIANAMESKIERADTGWLIGLHKAEVQIETAFMEPLVSTFYLAMLCEDQVQELSDNAIVLASAPQCPNMMVQFGENMLGIQGRPEFSPVFAKRLLNLRQEEFPSKRFAKGIDSLTEQEPDNELIFKWFANFIRLGQLTDDSLSKDTKQRDLAE